MSAFTAYFDAGGHPSDQPFVVVSGYMANFLQWQVFNANWTAAHAKFQKPLPFHATDFMHGKPPYDDWPVGTVGTKESFLISLCIAQQISMLVSISCVVDMGDFRGINEVFQMDTMLPAFALGARYCIEISRLEKSA